MFPDSRPPCWAAGSACPNSCAQSHYDQVVHNHFNLTGPWAEWRLRGRDLVSPTGERISPERLAGILFREANERRLDVLRTRRAAQKNQLVRVLVVDLGEYRQNGLAAS